MQSAIYEGSVFHRRLEPRVHEFRYRLFLMYLDLAELPELFQRRWLWSASRPNLVWFRRADYMQPSEQPLREVVLDRVEAELGRRPRGAVRVLTHLRTFGYVFNPVSFYYCFDEDDALEAVAAEITNTPWRERHTYVIDARRREIDGDLRARFHKEFHVSPFHGMDVDYEWRFSAPGQHLEIQMANISNGRPMFHAGLDCRRREITTANLAGALVRHPLLTARIHAAIHVQAARLWLKGVPFHTHPDTRPKVRDAHTT